MKRTPARSQASGSKAAPVRIDGVAVRTVGTELVVYDPDTTCTHVLNPVAAAVFSAVDGVRDRDAILLNASVVLGEPVGLDQVDRALADLHGAGVICRPASDLGRRRLIIGGTAAAAMAVPTVLSVVAPTPAAAMSGGGTTGGGSSDGGSSDGGVDGGSDGGVVTTPTTLPPNPEGNVTTLTGDTRGFADGIGTAAKFNYPFGLAVASDGTIYVADSTNNRVRAINPTTGAVTTLAGGSTSGTADGVGAATRFFGPSGVAVGPHGTVYVADTVNHRIRAINPTTGAVTTLAGSSKGSADGTGSSAKFDQPYGVAVAPDGTLYVADTYNYRIRAVNPTTRVVTTLAGSGQGFADKTGTAAQFSGPYGIAVGSNGAIYVADSAPNHRIRVIDPTTGAVTTLAGGTNGSADGTGTAAQFSFPSGVAVGPNGTLFVADNANSRIRVVNPATGAVTTLAGDNFGDTDGTGTSALFRLPCGVAVGPNGTVYVSDTYNHRIRTIT